MYTIRPCCAVVRGADLPHPAIASVKNGASIAMPAFATIFVFFIASGLGTPGIFGLE
jgi:hypothetical protein